jgi:hypothetical protein
MNIVLFVALVSLMLILRNKSVLLLAKSAAERGFRYRSRQLEIGSENMRF